MLAHANEAVAPNHINRYILSAEDNQVLAEELADVASQSLGDAMCFAIVSGMHEAHQWPNTMART